GVNSDRRALAGAGDSRRPAFLRITRPYARRRVARGLDGLWVHGLAGARAALADRPVVFAANHVAWWDPLVLLVLDEALGGVGWAVVDARSIRTLPFLGWLGASRDHWLGWKQTDCWRNIPAKGYSSGKIWTSRNMKP
ncbi:MAG: hypothetical protein WCI43_07860, partial [Candidatus Firestonebacteria bacterium]